MDDLGRDETLRVEAAHLAERPAHELARLGGAFPELEDERVAGRLRRVEREGQAIPGGAERQAADQARGDVRHRRVLAGHGVHQVQPPDPALVDDEGRSPPGVVDRERLDVPVDVAGEHLEIPAFEGQPAEPADPVDGVGHQEERLAVGRRLGVDPRPGRRFLRAPGQRPHGAAVQVEQVEPAVGHADVVRDHQRAITQPAPRRPGGAVRGLDSHARRRGVVDRHDPDVVRAAVPARARPGDSRAVLAPLGARVPGLAVRQPARVAGPGIEQPELVELAPALVHREEHLVAARAARAPRDGLVEERQLPAGACRHGDAVELGDVGEARADVDPVAVRRPVDEPRAAHVLVAVERVDDALGDLRGVLEDDAPVEHRAALGGLLGPEVSGGQKGDGEGDRDAHDEGFANSGRERKDRRRGRPGGDGRPTAVIRVRTSAAAGA